jgi:predicted ArsR family transcriptional regulator
MVSYFCKYFLVIIYPANYIAEMNKDTHPRTRDRLLYLLKTRGAQSTPNLARKLSLTPMAVRLHLQSLEEEGLLHSTNEPQKLGRPRKSWSLTRAGHKRFPESYGDLAVDLILETKRQFGGAAIDSLLEARLVKQTATYKASMPPSTAELGKRVQALARLRSEDGYMAETRKQADGCFLLIENHCPICAAATVCVGLCNTELRLFEAVLGRGVLVERQEHLLNDERRCTYRIRPRSLAAGVSH